MPDKTVNSTKLLPRGAIPSSRAELAAATPHVPDPQVSVPASFLMWPVQMAYWGNGSYNDCVTAEEAFAKATAVPQTFVPEATVIAWAFENAYSNGAKLPDVLRTLQQEGFPLNGELYNDGNCYSVDWTNAGILQSAVYACGPVKLGVASTNLEAKSPPMVNPYGGVTDGVSGWALYNYPAGEPMDHCVSVCGYGTLAELVRLFQQHNIVVSVPSGMPTGPCYAVFTWNSIGIIDRQSLLNMTYEAWIREPVTVVKAKRNHIPVPVRNHDGRLEVFARGSDGAVYYNSQTSPHTESWSGWQSLGMTTPGDPVAAVNVDGRLEVFARDADGALWHNAQSVANGPWSGWVSFGNVVLITDDFSVHTQAGGCLEIFARGAVGGALWHVQQLVPGQLWADWMSLNGIITSKPAIADNSMEVFARGLDNALWHIWKEPAPGPWSSWQSLGNVIASDPAVVVNTDNRLEVFVSGADGALWHIWQEAPNSGPWSNWESLGGILTSDPAAVVNSDGRVEVFGRGTDGALWHIWQTQPHAGPWSAWASLGGVITSDPAVVVNSDGRLEAFARGTDGALWHIWQTPPHSGPWSEWVSLAGSF